MRQVSQLDKALQRYARQFMETKHIRSIDLDDFANWLLKKELWKPDPSRIRRLLREDVSHALSEERFTDDDCRRVRRYHVIPKVKKNERQQSLWSPIENISRKDMELSLKLRRKDMVSRAVQVKNDLDHYNKFVNKGRPIQMSFDLTNDVKEAEASRTISQETVSSSASKRPSSQSHSASSDSASQRGHARP